VGNEIGGLLSLDAFNYPYICAVLPYNIHKHPDIHILLLGRRDFEHIVKRIDDRLQVGVVLWGDCENEVDVGSQEALYLDHPLEFLPEQLQTPIRLLHFLNKIHKNI